MDLYTVVSVTEDGDASLEVMAGALLEERLADGYYGKCKFGSVDLGAHTDLLSGRDGDIFIMKGRPIIPRPVETVTRYEL